MAMDYFSEWTKKYEPMVQSFIAAVNAFLTSSSASVPERHQELVYEAIRKIKNLIIGNRTKKDIFVKLGLVQPLIKIIVANPSNPNDPKNVADWLKIQRECVIVFGSLAHGSAYSVETLVEQGVLIPLLDRTLMAEDEKLLESGLRASEALLRYHGTPKTIIFEDGRIMPLIQLLSAGNNGMIAESVAMMIANCCDGTTQQNAFAKSGTISKLAKLLACPFAKTREAALDALAALCRENESLGKDVALAVVEGKTTVVQALLQFVKDNRALTRLLACTCLTNLHKTGSLNSSESTSQSHHANIPQYILPTLVKLLQEKGAVRVRAPLVLAYLVSDSETLQKAASDSDAVNKLANMLIASSAIPTANVTDIAGNGPESTLNSKSLANFQDQMKESALLAIAAICSLKEECRKQVIDAKVLPHIVAALENPDASIRAAACQCTRSLSRSVKALRTNLVDAGIAVPLVKLLSDDSMDVQTTASATVCNLVLEFAPMKKIVIENGAVEKLVSLVKSMDNNLRLNAVWTLKNLLYQAEGEIKAKVINQLSFTTLEELISDDEISVQEQALNLLRNLVCGKESDIELVFREMGEEKLMNILDLKLKSEQTVILTQAIFVLVNISIGSNKHKESILRRDNIIGVLKRLMSHDSASIRVAIIWCLINLTWNDDSMAQARVSRLRIFGFEEKLRGMLEDSDLDVVDRVKTALSNFNSSSSNGTGNGNSGGNSANNISGSGSHNSNISNNMQLVD